MLTLIKKAVISSAKKAGYSILENDHPKLEKPGDRENRILKLRFASTKALNFLIKA